MKSRDAGRTSTLRMLQAALKTVLGLTGARAAGLYEQRDDAWSLTAVEGGRLPDSYRAGLGMEVDGQAQVSMNLVDVEKTPLYRAFDMVKMEAQAQGVAPTWSEIVATGYGTSIRRELSSSVSSVTGAEVQNSVVAGVDAALQGKPGDGAIHHARIEEKVTQCLGKPQSNGGFARGGGSVNCDDGGSLRGYVVHI